MTVYTHRPNTGTWTTEDHDEYQEGHEQGQQRANGQGPEPLNTRPRDPYAWGIHDGYHGITPVAHPNQTDDDSDRGLVHCDENCGALKNPETLDEYRAALEHWISHSGQDQAGGPPRDG